MRFAGNFTATELHITETTTAIELIQLYLDFSGLTEDINLFMLSEVSLAPLDGIGKLVIDVKVFISNYLN